MCFLQGPSNSYFLKEIREDIVETHLLSFCSHIYEADNFLIMQGRVNEEEDRQQGYYYNIKFSPLKT